MALKDSIKNATRVSCKFIKKNSPLILTVMGITGGVTTVIMVGKVSPKAKEVLDQVKEDCAERGDDKKTLFIEEVKAVGPMYLPAAIMGGVSIACIIGSYSVNTRRAAALATAYSISETKLKDYQEKVIETIGKNKEEKVRKSIVEDKLKNNEEAKEMAEHIPEGMQLCYDEFSDRPFYNTWDNIVNVEKKLNQRLYSEMWVSLNDLFYELDMKPVAYGDDYGWEAGEIIDIRPGSHLMDNMATALSIEYSCSPRSDLRGLK